MKLLSDYIEAKYQLTKWKKAEAELRVALLDELFPAATEGTQTTFISGMEIKGGFKMSHKLDAKEVDENYDCLSAAEQDCINYKPSLSLAAYKALDEFERSDLDQYITVVPSMPTLTIKLGEEL